ncbi:MFS transporter [Nocardia jejuensis]|uniref:MFS transporter n=1 Tax=Nocardia jejuensis TaxID=328049 RepID=UPI00082E1983|nr:MFS transporter [Nocardia jejuensis]
MDSATTRMSRTQRWTLVITCLAIVLVIASMAALYTALPSIAASTGATQQHLTWIVDAYTLALACLVLPGGALGDRYGRRNALIVGLAIFALASAVPLVVHGSGWLIGSRAIAGVGAALVMPSTLSLLTAGFPPARRGVAIGIWAGMAGTGAVVGIIGSGLLLEQWSWQSIPLAMSVIGALLAVAACTLPESRDPAHPPFDLWGAALSAAAVGLLVLVTIEAPARGWSEPIVWIAGAGALVAGVAFVLVELRVTHPLLDVRLFTQRGFGSGTVTVSIQFLVSFGLFLLIVQYLQLILDYRPLLSAVAMAPMAGPMMALSPVSPWLAERFGLRMPTAVGLGILGIGLVSVARVSSGGGYLDLVLPLVITSAGLGVSAAAATTAIVSGVPAGNHGVAAAVNDAAREVGAAIGIALAGSILAAAYSRRIAPVIEALPEPLRAPVSDSLASALQVSARLGPQANPLAEAAEAAFIHGIRQASLVLGILTLVAAIVLGAWAPGRAIESSVPDEPAVVPGP